MKTNYKMMSATQFAEELKRAQDEFVHAPTLKALKKANKELNKLLKIKEKEFPYLETELENELMTKEILEDERLEREEEEFLNLWS